MTRKKKQKINKNQKQKEVTDRTYHNVLSPSDLAKDLLLSYDKKNNKKADLYIRNLEATENERIWLTKKRGDLIMKPSPYECRIASCLLNSNIEFIHRAPVIIQTKDERFKYFVEFFLPEYNIILTIEPYKKSEFFNEGFYKEKLLHLKRYSGCKFLEIEQVAMHKDTFDKDIRNILLQNFQW